MYLSLKLSIYLSIYLYISPSAASVNLIYVSAYPLIYSSPGLLVAVGSPEPTAIIYSLSLDTWNQWINASMDQWFNESMKQWINEPMIQWINESMNQWNNKSMNQWINESMHQWINASMIQWSSCILPLHIGKKNLFGVLRWSHTKIN